MWPFIVPGIFLRISLPLIDLLGHSSITYSIDHELQIINKYPNRGKVVNTIINTLYQRIHHMSIILIMQACIKF